ncbi:MAG: gliding motility-associated C-terminal domain-containing protein [Chitinophagaceae bacterium]|nr:gliding motility-associated C-terminal domain-containing protein [Chitinophagaceae bacterium]
MYGQYRQFHFVVQQCRPNNWYWDFGDGQTTNSGAGNTITHIYTAAQSNVVVKHVVTNAQGCPSDTARITLPDIFLTPVASFNIKKDTVCENRPVLFTSTATGIDAWNWDFGNGTGTSVPPFNRTYSSAGTYAISLTVSFNGCLSATVNDVLQVNPIPVVNAGPDKYKNSGNPVLLTASVSPASVYSYLWTPATGLNSANILQPLASPTVNTTYQLKAEDVNSHCSATDDVLVKVIPEVFIPNAFSPNGDNKNDKWVIPALSQFPDAVVRIYNRYGTVIFESKNYPANPWDGKYKGKEQPTGSYVYMIDLKDSRQQFFQGLVTIIR